MIATHGRSFYVLDNIAPLRQLDPAVTRAAVQLFRPSPAIRSVSQAQFDYYLAKPADKVKVDILDVRGGVIRSFVASAEEDKKKKPGAGDDDGEEGFGPPRLKPPTRTAGLNRFAWDLRYPGAKTFEGMVVWSARPESGPLAVPGEYQVRLTANGETRTGRSRCEWIRA